MGTWTSCLHENLCVSWIKLPPAHCFSKTIIQYSNKAPLFQIPCRVLWFIHSRTQLTNNSIPSKIWEAPTLSFILHFTLAHSPRPNYLLSYLHTTCLSTTENQHPYIHPPPIHILFSDPAVGPYFKIRSTPKGREAAFYTRVLSDFVIFNLILP